MNTIVITDLTRFSEGKTIVCIAGIEVTTGECIRPVPYLEKSTCEKYKILPGTILSGEFSMPSSIEKPHTEDRKYKNMMNNGFCGLAEFRNILERSASNNVHEGFNTDLGYSQKKLLEDYEGEKSIITIQLNPKDLSIVKDKYGKITVHFMDSSGRSFQYLPITDLGFHDYAMFKNGIENLDSLNKFINSQDELFLRIGLTRLYQGYYWMQVNGIYTFPNYLQDIRSYG
ncbi:MAG: hypothetical protein IPN87_18895 [Saprospiraceae bacterium]|nr:hypothetical protein [Candidatus Brachybacter algidus]